MRKRDRITRATIVVRGAESGRLTSFTGGTADERREIILQVLGNLK